MGFQYSLNTWHKYLRGEMGLAKDLPSRVIFNGSSLVGVGGGIFQYKVNRS